MHARCVMRNLFLFVLKKQAARANSLGATLTLRTRVRDPASVLLLFIFACRFSFNFPPLNGCVLLKYFTYVCMHLFGTARIATIMSCLCKGGQIAGILSSTFGRVSRVSRVQVPCVIRDVFVFFAEIKKTARLVQTWLGCNFEFCGRGFEPRQAQQALNKRFALPLFWFAFFFLLHILLHVILCIWSICAID